MTSMNHGPVRIVRYGELRPCRTAFIDAHTPGSDRKENFTIIGGGVSESADQHVHIRDTPGFNIGAAGQPPHCRNSLHAHRTAEVFFVHKGRWRFFWGRHGTAGEVLLEEGDLFDIPTGIFRGFENVGTDYGMIVSILGGDDAGGGVIWAPQVIAQAQAHGLVLSETGRLYDTRKGERLPEGVRSMPPLTEPELAAFPELPVGDVVPRFVARYQDMRALAAHAPARVIAAEHALIRDRPGFAVDLVSEGSAATTLEIAWTFQVLIVHRGHWRLDVDSVEHNLAPGDTCAIAAETPYRLAPSMSGEAAFFRIVPTGDSAGRTMM
jgi:mannose-6-phosphate isomerase-like protein (cupin superfamily)